MAVPGTGIASSSTAGMASTTAHALKHHRRHGLNDGRLRSSIINTDRFVTDSYHLHILDVDHTDSPIPHLPRPSLQFATFESL